MNKLLMINIASTLAVMLVFISLAIPQLYGKETKYKQVEWQKELPITAYSQKGESASGPYEATFIFAFLNDPNAPYPQSKYGDMNKSLCYKVNIYVNDTLIHTFYNYRPEDPFAGSDFICGLMSIGEGKVYDGWWVNTQISYIENVNSTKFSAIGFYQTSEPYYVDVFRYDILGRYLFNGLLFSGLAVLFEWSFVKKKLGKILLLNFVASLIVSGFIGLLALYNSYLSYAILSIGFTLGIGTIFYGLGFWGMIIITSILTAFIFCMAFTVAIWIIHKILKKTNYWLKKD